MKVANHSATGAPFFFTSSRLVNTSCDVTRTLFPTRKSYTRYTRHHQNAASIDNNCVFFSRRLKVQRQMECLRELQSHQLTRIAQSDAARRDSVSIRDSSVLRSIHSRLTEGQPRYMMVNCSHHLLLSHFKSAFQTLLGSR